jgi:hypothetical protein
LFPLRQVFLVLAKLKQNYRGVVAISECGSGLLCAIYNTDSYMQDLKLSDSLPEI